jgi:FkbM family methyltransferase
MNTTDAIQTRPPNRDLRSLRAIVGNALTPAARAWIRYAPGATAKRWLWQTFHWRQREFACRTRYGARMFGNTQDLIQRHIYFFGNWEPNISAWIEATLRPGDCFVDVGANIGHYSLLASRLVGDSGHVVAIEAAPWIHAWLDRHVRLNQCRNIRTVAVAAATERGVVKLYAGNPGNIGKTSTIARAGTCIDVPALPLAEILQNEECARARIIKIDVEGAELEVLHGLAPLLPRLRNDVEIIMEIAAAPTPESTRMRDEIFATMHAHGFSAFVFDNDYGVDTYLQPNQIKQPVKLSDERITAQADVLFSRIR